MQTTQYTSPRVKGQLERAHHAARPPRNAAINADVMAKLTLMERAVESLTREGHAVVGVDLLVSKPTIQIQASSHLAKLAENGQGAYYMRGVGADGLAFRKGCLLAYRNVTVVWFERGH